MATRSMLTTIDNPYSPFDEWAQWYAFDMTAGYNTSGLLARIAKVSDEVSEVDFDHDLELAMDEIVRENVSGVHRKISKEVEED